MGLIHRAQGITEDKPSLKAAVSPIVHALPIKKKSGLLRKVAYSSAYDAIDLTFSGFLHASGRSRGGILFTADTGGTKILFPMGLDFTTSRRFIPEASFLESRIAQGLWRSVDGSNLGDWQSLFSNHEFTSACRILIRPIPVGEGTSCYVILLESLLDVARDYPDIADHEDEFQTLASVVTENVSVLQALSRVESINKSYEAKKSHIESALAAKKSATLLTVSCKDLYGDEQSFITDGNLTAVYGAVAHQIARLAGSTNVIEATSEGLIRVVLFTALPADVVFYARQLMKPLERLFGIDRVRRITVSDSGKTNSLSEIMGFLAGES